MGLKGGLVSRSFNSIGLNMRLKAAGGYRTDKRVEWGSPANHPSPLTSHLSLFTSHFSFSQSGCFRIHAGAEIAEENEIFYLARILERDPGLGGGSGTEDFVVG
jgi:hypothetical protein